MRSIKTKTWLLIVCAAAGTVPLLEAQAGPTIPFGPDQSRVVVALQLQY